MKETRTTSNRRGRPPATEADLANARQQVMDAAREVYAEQGYDRTTVELILAKAGISRPSFYKLFGNKHEVLKACVEQVVAQLYGDVARRVMVAKTPLQQVAESVRAYLEWGASMGAVTTRFYSEMAHPDSPFGEFRQRLIGQLINLFQAQIRHLGRPQPDPLLLEALVATVEYVGSRYFLESDRSPEEMERRYAIAMRVLLAALAQPEEITELPPIPLTE